MALVLQPGQEETLQSVICVAFTGEHGHGRLKDFVKDALQFDIYVKLGGPDTPIEQFATKLIEEVSSEGTFDPLLRKLLVHRKGDRILRDLVGQVLPDALALVPQADHEKALLESAQGGVGALERLRSDPAVSARLSEAAVDLKAIAANLALLAAYKNMHDVLHTVQLRLYPPITDEIAAFKDDLDAAGNLSIHARELSSVAADATEFAATFPDAGLAVQEKGLSATLETLATKLKEAADREDQPAAKAALMQLKQLLRFHPPRLNHNLVAAARQIPVGKLVETMRVAAASLADADPERRLLTDAGTALETLMRDIQAQVEEHEAWQMVENHLWGSEEALQRDDELAAEELTILWPLVTGQIEAIGVRMPGSWMEDLQRYATDFSTACPMPATPPLAREARRAFKRYVYLSRLHFYDVDRALQSRCSDVATLSQPLKQLIGP